MKQKYLVDTNILVRLLINDDLKQHTDLLNLLRTKEIEFFVPSLVIFETYWVLSSRYKIDKDNIVSFMIEFNDANNVFLEESALIYSTLTIFKNTNVDFVDTYLSEKARLVNLPVLTWNKKDFNKLKSESYAPFELL